MAESLRSCSDRTEGCGGPPWGWAGGGGSGEEIASILKALRGGERKAEEENSDLLLTAASAVCRLEILLMRLSAGQTLRFSGPTFELEISTAEGPPGQPPNQQAGKSRVSGVGCSEPHCSE